MNIFSKMNPITNKALKSLSQEELKKVLDGNQSEDLQVLAGVCSEVLRRMINGEWK